MLGICPEERVSCSRLGGGEPFTILVRAPIQPSVHPPSCAGANSTERVPVSGMAPTAAPSATSIAVNRLNVAVIEDEKAPSTKPSIVPGPLDEAKVVVELIEPQGGHSSRRTAQVRSRAPAIGLAFGLVLVSVAVLIEGWGRSFGVLCGAAGGAVIVLGLLLRGGPKSL